MSASMLAAAARLLEIPEGLRAWLASLPPTTRVGLRQEGESCPLTKYLEHHGIQVSLDLDHVYVFLDGGTEEFSPPPWSQRFMRLVDRRRGGIQARTALRLLDEAEREVPS